MEVLLSMMFGLSLRMILSSTQGRLYAAMIGVWEGACLRYLTHQTAQTTDRVLLSPADIDSFAQLISIGLWSILGASVIGIAESLEVEDAQAPKTGNRVQIGDGIAGRNRRRLSASRRLPRPTASIIQSANHHTEPGTSSATINSYPHSLPHLPSAAYSDVPSSFYTPSESSTWDATRDSSIGRSQVVTPGASDSLYDHTTAVSSSSSPLRIPFPVLPPIPNEQTAVVPPRIPVFSPSGESEYLSESIAGPSAESHSDNSFSGSYDSYTLPRPRTLRNTPPIVSQSPLPILLNNFMPLPRTEPESRVYHLSPVAKSDSLLDETPGSFDELQTPITSHVPFSDDDDDEEGYRDELRTPRALARHLALSSSGSSRSLSPVPIPAPALQIQSVHRP
ncbi:hypothetical protein C8R42DRAFT_463699 [Lentinula raphanica]|nr:hypothetical protein C8R42DRAFT_463699 [Lentinula raphanica]